MTGEEILETLLSGVLSQGPFSLKEMLVHTRQQASSGIGVTGEKKERWYILFLKGEPEGAILADSRGNLYGNKAVYLLKGTERFHFYPSDPGVVERLVLSCRIFDKKILDRKLPGDIPEMVIKTESGVGLFSMQVTKKGIPQPGQRVTIRKLGQITGSDTTNGDGKVSFKLLFGRYECIIMNPDLSTRVYEFEFSPDLLDQVVGLEISS